MTWDDRFEVAFGVLGLTPLTFWPMSLREFRAAQRGFFEKQQNEIKQRWEIGRFIAYFSVLPYQKKGHRLKPTDLLRFSWETQGERTTMTPEQIEYESRKMGTKVDEHGNFFN